MKKRSVKKIIFSLLFIGFFSPFIFLAVLWAILPSAQEIKKIEFPETSIIYDRTGGHVLYEVYGEQNRKTSAHNEISDYMRKAVVAAEDDSFYYHRGFSMNSIIRAFRNNLENNRSDLQGGSTITQQLARNIFLSREKTYTRKIKEIAMAVKIESFYSKDEIMDAYLNTVSFGSNTYGVETASEMFFGKKAGDLTADEAALLASTLKAPSYYSPYGNHSEELESRQKYVLKRMEELSLISESEYRKAESTNILAKIKINQDKINAPHFVFYLMQKINEKYGEEYLREGGLRIISTLDYDLQKKAEEIIGSGVQINKTRYNAKNASMVVLNPKTGEVLAMVGSKDYFDKSIDGEVNVSIQPRQPGSAFKPIVYAKAFEKGYQPETLLFDIKTDFGPDGSGKNYVPSDYDGRYRGMVSMRQALSMSLNIPAVQTLYLAGIDNAIDMAHKLGISTLKDRKRYGLALVLGGGEVKLLDLAGAYGVFANDGKKAQTFPIKKISDSKGRIIYENEFETWQAIDSQVARKINSILSDTQSRTPIFGANNPLEIKSRIVAAKTGTTQNFRDAWTVGYTPNAVVGVWTGNNDNKPMRMGADGIFVAAPIWRKMMDYLLINGYPDEKFIDYARVHSENGMVTGKIKGETAFFKKNGKKIKPEDLDKINPDEIETRAVGGRHSVLYYVDKDNPLGPPKPNRNDPMLVRWEKSLASGDNPGENNKKDKKKAKEKKDEKSGD